jgi:hypothetical protein
LVRRTTAVEHQRAVLAGLFFPDGRVSAVGIYEVLCASMGEHELIA